ncbi:MAG: hypothetical protein QXF12_02270 [Candidatus Aenigmatarchaeota archaeon]
MITASYFVDKNVDYDIVFSRLNLLVGDSITKLSEFLHPLRHIRYLEMPEFNDLNEEQKKEFFKGFFCANKFYIKSENRSYVYETYYDIDNIYLVYRDMELMDYKMTFLSDAHPYAAYVNKKLETEHVELLKKIYGNILNLDIINFLFDMDRLTLIVRVNERESVVYIRSSTPLYAALLSLALLFYFDVIIIDDSFIKMKLENMLPYYEALLFLLEHLPEKQVFLVYYDDFYYLPFSYLVARNKKYIDMLLHVFFDRNHGIYTTKFLENGGLGNIVDHRFFTYSIDIRTKLMNIKYKDLIENNKELSKKISEITSKIANTLGQSGIYLEQM